MESPNLLLRWKTFSNLFFSFSLLLLLHACRADYTEEAIAKARIFALERTKNLTETQQDYIRYASPELQQRVIFAYEPYQLAEHGHISRRLDHKPIRSPRLDFMETYVVWNIPGVKYSVIVIGTGERSMNFWDPAKVIFKTLAPADSKYEKARSEAVMYVINNMLSLSTSERNRVRFSEAEVCKTKFDLSYMIDPDKKPENEWEKYLASLNGNPDKVQFSLVWNGDEPDKKIVITGFGIKNSLEGWTPLSGMKTDLKKLDAFISSSAETPAVKKEKKP